MAILKSGVILKLLEGIKKDDDDGLENDLKPVLLQIRSIIPVLEEGDLWPNRGFLLKVSDSSHALYVSMSEEQNEMILGNRLKLGQYIYAQKLEKAHPVPLLRGIIPVPGRRPFEGTPEDVVSPASLVKLLEASAVDDSIVEKGVILEKKISETQHASRSLIRGLSDSKSSSKGLEGGYKGRHHSLSTWGAGLKEIRVEDFERNGFSGAGVWPKSRPSSVDNDSDADSVISTSSRISKRRSWNASEILAVKEIFDSSIAKHELRPPRSRSANASPVRSVRCDSSDDNSSSTSRRRVADSAKRLIKTSNKSHTLEPKVNNNVQMPYSLGSLVHDRKGAETGVSWNSLPSSIVKLGKEVVRQRDTAVLAAADALQEACASERLLNSLSKLSEFPLVEGDDLQPYVDRFSEFQDDLARTRLIMQSLTSITPFRNQETESCTTNSVKETLSIALERKKNAKTWIKSAIALDLCPLGPLSDPANASDTQSRTGRSDHGHKPKGSFLIKNTESPLILPSDKDDQAEWSRGSTLPAASDLASSLQNECRKLFLSYVEKYLDEVQQKSSSREFDGQLAGMMYNVKRVSEWLDVIVSKEGRDNLEDTDIDAYERVRKKIYTILLKHVERTAMAFERLRASA